MNDFDRDPIYQAMELPTVNSVCNFSHMQRSPSLITAMGAFLLHVCLSHVHLTCISTHIPVNGQENEFCLTV